MGRKEDIEFLVEKKYKDVENKKTIFSKTAPFDFRFPNQNQTRNCFQNYLDFHRCQKIKGKDYDPCYGYQRSYLDLCPVLWVQKWDEQVENGCFAGNI